MWDVSIPPCYNFNVDQVQPLLKLKQWMSIHIPFFYVDGINYLCKLRDTVLVIRYL